MSRGCANKCIQNGGVFGCEICYRNDFRYIDYENEIETDTETEIEKENQLDLQDLNAEAIHFLRMYPIYLLLSRCLRKGQLTVSFISESGMLMVFHDKTDL